jgi:hypothetical protein
VVLNFCSYACQTKKASPPPSTMGLAKALPSEVRWSSLIFLFDEGVIIWLPGPLLPPGPLGLLLFTTKFSTDVMGTFFITFVFMTPISSAGSSSHLPHPVFSFSPRFLSVFCCYFCCVCCFQVHGPHQVLSSPQNSRGFL